MGNQGNNEKVPARAFGVLGSRVWRGLCGLMKVYYRGLNR